MIHNQVNLFVLAAIPAEDLEVSVPKAKSVGGQFAHIHHVRVMWLKSIDPGLTEGLVKFEANADKAEMSDQLTKSARAIAAVIDAALANGTRVKGFKPTAEAFAGYLMTHEANHRAMAELALRQVGKPIPEKVAFGQWEWGSRFGELEIQS